MLIMLVALDRVKSTNGTVLVLGKCTIRNTCKSQAVITLSSGEAEYYSLASGICPALGEQSTLLDWVADTWTQQLDWPSGADMASDV